MANKFKAQDGFVYDHIQDIAYQKLRCEICGKEFMFRVTQTALAVLTKIPMPKNCDVCEGKVNNAVQERAPMNPSILGLLGPGMMGMMGAVGGEATSTMTVSTFSNPYAQQQNALYAAQQAQLFHQQYAQGIAAMAMAKRTKAEEEKPVKEAPKIELNPKRAVQLEE